MRKPGDKHFGETDYPIGYQDLPVSLFYLHFGGYRYGPPNLSILWMLEILIHLPTMAPQTPFSLGQLPSNILLGLGVYVILKSSALVFV